MYELKNISNAGCFSIMKPKWARYAVIIPLLLTPALADPPRIHSAEARLQSNQLFTIFVTVQHNDTGWDHYASEWAVEIDGQIAGTRTLYHPHVSEQPFTRQLRDIAIPTDVRTVRIIARCNKGNQSTPYILLSR